MRDGEADALITLAPAPSLRPLAELERRGSGGSAFDDLGRGAVLGVSGLAAGRAAPRRARPLDRGDLDAGGAAVPRRRRRRRGRGRDPDAGADGGDRVRLARTARERDRAPAGASRRCPAELDRELAPRRHADRSAGRPTPTSPPAVVWLLSDDAAQVNGEILRLDGGYTITGGLAARPERVERSDDGGSCRRDPPDRVRSRARGSWPSTCWSERSARCSSTPASRTTPDEVLVPALARAGRRARSDPRCPTPISTTAAATRGCASATRGALFACHEHDRRWIESNAAMLAENYRWHELYGLDELGEAEQRERLELLGGDAPIDLGLARRRDDPARSRPPVGGASPARPHARAHRHLGARRPDRDHHRRGAAGRHL